jgi:UDP-glucose 4-epimerase
MRLLVTASASPLATALLPTLAADERVEQIIGLDEHETEFSGPRFTQVLLDIRSSQVARLIAGMDAVLHLGTAAMLDASGEKLRDRALLTDIAVQGAQNLFRCAAEQGLRCVVHVSTAAIYALPPRQRPITEQHARAALPGFAWAEDHIALENWLDAFASENAATRLVRLRPHLLVGRRASPRVRALLRAPFNIRLAGRPPRLQCLHVDDLGRAILQALFRRDAEGAFNLACGSTATLHEMQRTLGRGLLPLPFPLAYQLVRLASRLGFMPEPAWMEVLRHEMVLDTTRARRRLGWKPHYETVAACLQAPE